MELSTITVDNKDYTYEDILNIGVVKQYKKTTTGNDLTIGTQGKVFQFYHRETETYTLKINPYTIHQIYEKLDSNKSLTIAFIMLSDNIDKTSNTITYTPNNHKKTTYATTAQLYSIMDLSERQGKSVLKRFKDLKMIYEFTSSDKSITFYVINPLYCYKSKDLSIQTYMLFREQLESVVTKKAAEDLKLIYWAINHDEDVEALKNEYNAQVKAEEEEAMNDDSLDDLENYINKPLEPNKRDDFFLDNESKKYDDAVYKLLLPDLKKDYKISTIKHKSDMTVHEYNYCINALGILTKTKDVNKAIIASHGLLRIDKLA